MTNPAAPKCPFTTGGKVSDQASFVGRKDELRFILSQMQDNHQPGSIVIVGRRQVGKSSLLYNFFQTYEDRVNQVDKFVVIYLSLQQANCQTQAGFYQTIAAEASKQPKVQTKPALADPLKVNISDAVTFGRVLEAWKTAGVILVICLDDFECLIDRSDHFDDNFYDNLRALIQNQCLMMIIASCKSLSAHSKGKKLTSDFFNVFAHRRLGELTKTEALELVQLPNPTASVLGEERQLLAEQWGGRNPYLLQVAGRCLWEARENDWSMEWARRQFLDQTGGTPHSFWRLVWRFFVTLGDGTQRLGNKIDSLGSFVKGLAVLLLSIALVMGIVKIDWQQVSGWFFRSSEDTKQTK